MTEGHAVMQLYGQIHNDCGMEDTHRNADKILCDFLESLGYHQIVKAFNDVDKHYARREGHGRRYGRSRGRR